MKPKTHTASASESSGFEKAAPRICSFEKNPKKGMTPTSDTDPMRNDHDVRGSCLSSPPYLRMSCSSFMAWMTLPAAMKRKALKKARERRWQKPDEEAPTPTARNMS